MQRTVAVVRKVRTSGETVEAHELVGDIGGRPAVIVDDMISTGATIEAAMNVIVACGGTDDIVVAATHGLLVGEAIDRISTRGARRLLVTDTVTRPGESSVEVCSVSGLVGDAIARLHRSEPLDDLLLHT